MSLATLQNGLQLLALDRPRCDQMQCDQIGRFVSSRATSESH